MKVNKNTINLMAKAIKSQSFVLHVKNHRCFSTNQK